MKKADFPQRILTGDDNSPLANGQKPPPVDTQNPVNCLFGTVGPDCANNNGQNNGNGNNNGGGNNNGNGGGNGQVTNPAQPNNTGG
jgi:hypothetical protein